MLDLRARDAVQQIINILSFSRISAARTCYIPKYARSLDDRAVEMVLVNGKKTGAVCAIE